MREADVLAYLQQNPDFLLQYGRQLGVRVEAGKVQSFAQAQWLAQQDKTTKMAQQLRDMMQQAADNVVISERMMRFAARLMAANTLLQVFNAASGSLKADFDLPAHVIHLFDVPKKKTALPDDAVLAVHHPARAVLLKQQTVLCGSQLPAAVMKLLPQAGKGLESFLCLPLLADGVVRGAIVAGDADAERFVADMPTDRVAELAHLTALAMARTGGW